MPARAQWIALVLPAALMVSALGSQYLGHLYPCEMCWWQRWPHYAAIGLALLAFAAPQGIARRVLIAGAAGGILTSGLIGVYHAGVEYHWWLGPTHCTGTASGHNLADIMSAPLIRCDQPQWTLFGVSLAGFNALISVSGALYIFSLLRRTSR
jgi:disulfide bond formation protein DsbB